MTPPPDRLLQCISMYFYSLLLFSDVTWQGQEARLTLHYDNGFTLSDTRPEDGRKAQIFWHFAFEKLRMSADDGIRLLWLDFGEEGEQVIIIIFTRTFVSLFDKMPYFIQCLFLKRTDDRNWIIPLREKRDFPILITRKLTCMEGNEESWKHD